MSGSVSTRLTAGLRVRHHEFKTCVRTWWTCPGCGQYGSFVSPDRETAEARVEFDIRCGCGSVEDRSAT